MKTLTITSLLLFGSLASADFSTVDAKNPIFVYCNSGTTSFIQEGFRVNIEDGNALSIESMGESGVTTITLLPDETKCSVEANFKVEGDPSMGISN